MPIFLRPTSSPSDLSIRIASGLRLWTRRIPSIAAIFSADKCIDDLLRSLVQNVPALQPLRSAQAPSSVHPRVQTVSQLRRYRGEKHWEGKDSPTESDDMIR